MHAIDNAVTGSNAEVARQVYSCSSTNEAKSDAQDTVHDHASKDMRYMAVYVRRHHSDVLLSMLSPGLPTSQSKKGTFWLGRPEPGQAQVTPQEAELVAAKWMPLQEFGALEFLRQRPLHAMILDRCLAYARGDFKGLERFKLGGGLRLEEELLLTGQMATSDEPSRL